MPTSPFPTINGQTGPFSPQYISQNTKVTTSPFPTINGATGPFSPSYIAQQTPNPTINVQDLNNPTTPITLPPPPVDTTNYNSLIAGGNANISALNTAPTANQNDIPQYLKDYLGGTPPANPIDTYNQDYTKLGIDAKQQAVNDSTNKINGLNAQLQGITAEQTAQELQMKEQGISAGAIQGRDATLARQNAIRALPIQAQILAEQATLTGNTALLAQAQDKLNQTFKIQNDYNTQLFNYKQDLRKAVYDYADKSEQRQLDAQKLLDQQSYDAMKTNNANAHEVAIKALENGQADIAARIEQIDWSNPYAPIQFADLEKKISLSANLWSNPYIDQTTGNQVQRNTKTGEIRTLNNPSDVSSSTGNYIPGSDPSVDNWARLIISGQAKITDVPNPRGSTLRTNVIDAISNSSQLLLSDKDREKLSTLDTAFNVYNTIKDLSAKINTFGVLGRVTGALGRYLGGATQYNTDIARYNATRQGFVSNVARTLGEKGTLAEGDVQRAINNLPTINDTKAVAEGKLATLKSILEGARTSIVQKSTSPVSGLSQGTLPQIDNYQDYLKTINSIP